MKQKSSGVRMKLSGHRAIQLWPTNEDHDLLAELAAEEGRAITQFVLFHIMRMAKSRKKRRKSA
jgi:hypothetical protein